MKKYKEGIVMKKKNDKNKHGVINGTPTGKAVFRYLTNVKSSDFLDTLVGGGEIEEADKEMGYGTCVIDMDRNAVAYILAMMAKELSLLALNNVVVVEGKYGGEEHTWIIVDDQVEYIAIDPTLAQFEGDEVPDISIVDLKENDNYEWTLNDAYSAIDWLEEYANTKFEGVPTEEEASNIEDTTVVEYEYEIGSGIYTSTKELSGLELFRYVLEEYSLELDSLFMKEREDEYQDIKIKIDKAIDDTKRLGKFKIEGI